MTKGRRIFEILSRVLGIKLKINVAPSFICVLLHLLTIHPTSSFLGEGGGVLGNGVYFGAADILWSPSGV